MSRVLIVTAVAGERDAVAGALGAGHTVIVGGVGPAESAAATARALSTDRCDLVISAGIGGGFAPLRAGELAVASAIVFADLGAETPDGFAPAAELGLGSGRYEVDPRLAVELADRTGGHLGTILTVATVTGTAATADALLRRHPDAVAEGMEGAGVAAAAARCGVPFAELRAISNRTGPRRREAWDIPAALHSLALALAAIEPATLELQ
jgi:futalosine hydrolase